MSTATLEREAPPCAVDWKPWAIANDGVGERIYYVYRHGVDSDGRNTSEYHYSAKGTLIRYTLAGAEKKAHELNRDAAKAVQSAAYFARIEAERLEVQALAQEVREVAACGTLNSEAIARWIISNYTGNGAVEDMQGEHSELLRVAREDRVEIIGELNTAIDHATFATRTLDTVAGALQRLDEHNPLAYAYGATDLDRVRDVLAPAIEAITAPDADFKFGDLPEKREVK